MTPARLEAIKDRRKAITPGEWRVYGREIANGPPGDASCLVAGRLDRIDSSQWLLDAAFIAAAPADIDALTVALEDAWTLLDRVARDADGFEAGRMAGRAEMLSLIGGFGLKEILVDHIWLASKSLGPAVPLPHDELRRENERLRAALAKIRQFRVLEGAPPYIVAIDTLRGIASDALKES